MAAGIHEEGWSRIDEDGELWRRTGKVGCQETLEDLEKLLEEAKELCEKRSGGLLLSRIILVVKSR
jgi:chaperonin cofactor prefoldin